MLIQLSIRQLHQLILWKGHPRHLPSGLSVIFDLSHPVFVFAGPGNNGGDALAIARMLYIRNYRVKVIFIKSGRQPSPDCMINYNRFKELVGSVIIDLNEDDPLPAIPSGACGD